MKKANDTAKTRYNKAKMKSVGGMYKAAFVDDFKKACKALGVTQSQAIREAMQAIIDKASETN